MDQVCDIAGNEARVACVLASLLHGSHRNAALHCRFQKLHPNISIELDEGENDELVEWLSEGQLDLIVTQLSIPHHMTLLLKTVLTRKIVRDLSLSAS